MRILEVLTSDLRIPSSKYSLKAIKERKRRPISFHNFSRRSVSQLQLSSSSVSRDSPGFLPALPPISTAATAVLAVGPPVLCVGSSGVDKMVLNRACEFGPGGAVPAGFGIRGGNGGGAPIMWPNWNEKLSWPPRIGWVSSVI